jgi:branched-chain amino acid transport system permease protein
LAGLISGLLAILIDGLILRPLRARNAPHLAPMIATIGVGIFLTSIIQGLMGAEVRRFPSGTLSEESITWQNLHITYVQLGIMLIALLMVIALWLLMKKTQLGRALRAIAESPKAAALLGIPVEKLFYLTSFMAGFLGGIAGVLVGLSFNAISPFMGQPMLHKGDCSDYSWWHGGYSWSTAWRIIPWICRSIQCCLYFQ